MALQRLINCIGFNVRFEDVFATDFGVREGGSVRVWRAVMKRKGNSLFSVVVSVPHSIILMNYTVSRVFV